MGFGQLREEVPVERAEAPGEEEVDDEEERRDDGEGADDQDPRDGRALCLSPARELRGRQVGRFGHGLQFTLIGPLPLMLFSMTWAAALTRIATAKSTSPISKSELW